jgi:hypothetical protein
MWQNVLRFVTAILLMIHGFAHWQIATGWGSRSAESSWLLIGLGPDVLSSIGTFLWVMTLLTFIAAGIALMTSIERWSTLAIISSVFSLLVIGLFWQPNMVFGVAVDVGILVALLWAYWPVAELVGV